jgi:hypothetical protein
MTRPRGGYSARAFRARERYRRDEGKTVREADV